MFLIHGLSCVQTRFTKIATFAARRIGHSNAETKQTKKTRDTIAEVSYHKVSAICISIEIQVRV